MIVGLAVSMLFGNLVVEAASTHSATNKNILIIYTGGTIGMVNTPDGLKNEPGKGTQQLDKYLSLYPDHKDKIGKYEILSYDPLIDSSNMNPSDWNKMIKTIRDNYSQYDAFAKYGVIGILMRIEDKLQRCMSITKNGVNLISDEGIRDTLIDLHNYSAMALMLLDE